MRAIKVCFRTAGCQDRWTNVKDGTEYYFKFNSYGKWYGGVTD